MASLHELSLWHQRFCAYLQTQPRFAALAQALTMGEEAHSDPKAFVSQMNHQVTRSRWEKPFQDAVVAALHAYIHVHLGVAPIETPAEAQEPLARLNELGYATLPRIDAKRTAAIRDWFRDKPLELNRAGAEHERLSLEEARKKANIAHYRIADVMACPAFLEIALDPIRLGVAAAYLGATPTLINISAWWSFAGRPAAKDAQLFHLDVDDYRFLKFFIYLTDVGEPDGPHVYAPRSHLHQTVHGMLAAADDKAGFVRWYLQQLRKTDEDVIRAFGPPDSIMGPEGTNFVADTSGLHRGSLPTRHDRLICQAVYGLTPLSIRTVNQISVGAEGMGRLPADILTPPRDHILRMYLKP
ncbi:MAG: hypothetical protein QNJ84_03085 [Alphaproteobacteria bacterium]|nr:hypothetical protein [Alphaproteobacteria bacterium]